MWHIPLLKHKGTTSSQVLGFWWSGEANTLLRGSSTEGNLRKELFPEVGLCGCFCTIVQDQCEKRRRLATQVFERVVALPPDFAAVMMAGTWQEEQTAVNGQLNM